MKKYLRQYVLRRNFRTAKNTAKCPTAKKLYGEMFVCGLVSAVGVWPKNVILDTFKWFMGSNVEGL